MSFYWLHHNMKSQLHGGLPPVFKEEFEAWIWTQEGMSFVGFLHLKESNFQRYFLLKILLQCRYYKKTFTRRHSWLLAIIQTTRFVIFLRFFYFLPRGDPSIAPVDNCSPSSFSLPLWSSLFLHVIAYNAPETGKLLWRLRRKESACILQEIWVWSLG